VQRSERHDAESRFAVIIANDADEFARALRGVRARPLTGGAAELRSFTEAMLAVSSALLNLRFVAVIPESR